MKNSLSRFLVASVAMLALFTLESLIFKEGVLSFVLAVSFAIAALTLASWLRATNEQESKLFSSLFFLVFAGVLFSGFFQESFPRWVKVRMANRLDVWTAHQPRMLIKGQSYTPAFTFYQRSLFGRKAVSPPLPRSAYKLSLRTLSGGAGVQVKGDAIHGLRDGWYKIGLRLRHRPKHTKYRFQLAMTLLIGVGVARKPWKRINDTGAPPLRKRKMDILNSWNTPAHALVQHASHLYWTTTHIFRSRHGKYSRHGQFLTSNAAVKEAFSHPPSQVVKPALCHFQGDIFVMGGEHFTGEPKEPRRPSRDVYRFSLQTRLWRQLERMPVDATFTFAFAHRNGRHIRVFFHEGGRNMLYQFHPNTNVWRQEWIVLDREEPRAAMLWRDQLLLLYNYGENAHFERLDLKSGASTILALAGIQRAKSNYYRSDFYFVDNHHLYSITGYREPKLYRMQVEHDESDRASVTSTRSNVTGIPKRQPTSQPAIRANRRPLSRPAERTNVRQSPR